MGPQFSSNQKDVILPKYPGTSFRWHMVYFFALFVGMIVAQFIFMFQIVDVVPVDEFTNSSILDLIIKNLLGFLLLFSIIILIFIGINYIKYRKILTYLPDQNIQDSLDKLYNEHVFYNNKKKIILILSYCIFIFPVLLLLLSIIQKFNGLHGFSSLRRQINRFEETAFENVKKLERVFFLKMETGDSKILIKEMQLAFMLHQDEISYLYKQLSLNRKGQDILKDIMEKYKLLPNYFQELNKELNKIKIDDCSGLNEHHQVAAILTKIKCVITERTQYDLIEKANKLISEIQAPYYELSPYLITLVIIIPGILCVLEERKIFLALSLIAQNLKNSSIKEKEFSQKLE